MLRNLEGQKKGYGFYFVDFNVVSSLKSLLCELSDHRIVENDIQ